MERTFIEVPSFTRKWYALGLTNDDLIALQNAILQNPKGAGALIPGTGSMRKIRVPLKGHGKRGGARVIYVDIDVKETVYLINVYAKNEKDDMTDAKKKAFISLVKVLEDS